MARGWTIGLALLAAACGRSELYADAAADGSGSSSSASGGTTSSASSSSGGPASCPRPAVHPDELVDCAPLDVSIRTQQSCEIDQRGSRFPVQAFIDVDGCKRRVLASAPLGAGQLVSYCDATTLGLLLDRFLLAGLGPALGPAPRIATLGDTILCAPDGAGGLPPDVTFLGEELPPAYQNAPGALADDYELVLFCGFRIGWAQSPIDTLGRYANDFGGVVVVVLDYLSTDVDRSNVNALAERNGASFVGASLDHRDLEAYACPP
jgi:hypothetical protein